MNARTYRKILNTIAASLALAATAAAAADARIEAGSGEFDRVGVVAAQGREIGARASVPRGTAQGTDHATVQKRKSMLAKRMFWIMMSMR